MTCATPTLFDDLRAPRRPIARRMAKRGQETSLAAAFEHVACGEHRRQSIVVLLAVQASPGLTSLQLSKRCDCDRQAVARRLPELEKDGYIRRGDKVTDDTGRKAISWWPVEAGR